MAPQWGAGCITQLQYILQTSLRTSRLALGQPSTEGFDRSPNAVNELRAGTHQRLTRADDGHVSLALFAPVLEGVQQLRIEARQAGQVLKASTSSVFRLLA